MTAAIAKRLIKIDFANLINILMKRGIVPELIQDDCQADRIAETLLQVMTDPVHRDAQIEAGKVALQMLKPGALWPSAKAARVVLNLLDEKGE